MAVCLVATLLIIFGSAAIVNMIARLLQGGLFIDLTVIGIPLGRSLLAGSNAARRSAVALSGAVGIIILALGLAAIFRGAPSGEVPAQSWLTGLSPALTFTICALTFFLLRAAPVVQWFTSDAAGRSDHSCWTLPIWLAGTLLASSFTIRDVVTQTRLLGFYPVHTRFDFRDAATGEPINSIGYSADSAVTVNGRRDPFAPQLSAETSMRDGGITILLRGMASRPLEITFTSDGHHPCIYMLERTAPSEVTLKLDPVP